MKAMIFAAGLGTRLRPLTDSKPKALIEVGGRPMLERVILKLKESGFNHIVINVHYLSGQIIDFLHAKENFGIKIDVSDESGQLLDTGGGIKKAGEFLRGREPFLVHNVDIISNINLTAIYQRHLLRDPLATVLVSQRETSRYLLFDEYGRLTGWTNRSTGEVKSPLPDYNPNQYKAEAFAGIHVVSPKIFRLMKDWSDRFSIIDFYLSVAAKERIFSYPASNLKLIDIGKPETLAEAQHCNYDGLQIQ